MEEGKQKGNFLRAAGIFAAGGAVLAGSYFVCTRYDVVGKAQDAFRKTKAVVIDVFTTDPYEARDELISKIREYRKDFESGKYSVDSIISSVSETRSPEENVLDASSRLAAAQDGLYRKGIESLFSKVDEARKAYAADSLLEAMVPETRDKILNQLVDGKEEGQRAEFIAYKAGAMGEQSKRLVGDEVYRSLGEDSRKDFLERKLKESPYQTEIISKNVKQEIKDSVQKSIDHIKKMFD